jgi:demethylmenaquinone methyltransferase/2-methoxy-6-polyprenyl-1,4-benzoquinol methylase
MNFTPDSSHSSAPGTRPEGTADEREAARAVRRMFSRIAPRYDLLNHLLSLSLDRLWRRRTARRFRHILARPGVRALDLCCGTGDLTLELERAAAQRASNGATIWGTDFAHPMLVLARRKSARAGSRTLYLEADALALPFPDSSFDLVTAAFGFRNLANYRAGLAEIFRLLRPGGEVGILDFAAPRRSVFATLYRWYFQRLLPRVGGAVSGDAAAYSYLPRSVQRFPLPDELIRWFTEAGFAEARFERWSGGIVSLHTARKT